MKLSETGLRKNPTKLGVGEEHMTPSTFWFHYIDRNSSGLPGLTFVPYVLMSSQ